MTAVQGKRCAQALDPGARRFLAMAEGRPALADFEPKEARAAFLASRPAVAAPAQDLGEVFDFFAQGAHGDIPMRCYRSANELDDRSLPTLMFFHGGGFVVGDLDTHDSMCRTLAATSGCQVLAVHYRLAPEHRFPVSVDDAADSLRWTAKHANRLRVDPTRIAVCGDSAGGGLAAVLAIMARDGDVPPICYQALLYPVVDLGVEGGSLDEDFAVFNTATLRYFYKHYLRCPEDVDDWKGSPLRAARLDGVAPALVLTAGHDPLRDQGRQYASRLACEGVPVIEIHVTDMIHGFLGMGRVIPAAQHHLIALACHMRRAFLPVHSAAVGD